MSLDFAAKDVMRNRRVAMPFIGAIAATVGTLVFALNLSGVFQALAIDPAAKLFSSGYHEVFQQFNLILLIILGILPLGALFYALHSWIATRAGTSPR